MPVIIVATHNGQRICHQPDQLIKTMKDEYGHVFQLYEQIVLFNIMAVDSLSVKNFKEAISISKKRLHFVSIPYMVKVNKSKKYRIIINFT